MKPPSSFGWRRPSCRVLSTGVTAHNPRIYTYDVDMNGLVFLSSTKHKNFTTAQRDKVFLNQFYRSMSWNEMQGSTFDKYREEGYKFKSICMGEVNLVRSADTLVVFLDLEDDGTLRWGSGSSKLPFQPESLKVDPESGYVYHPSPAPPSTVAAGAASPFGKFSLIRWGLIMNKFEKAPELEMNHKGLFKGGRVFWSGKTWELGVLEPGMTTTCS
ncbi:hypothetical protein BT69DRAFT_774060 [Atractiella rhizophila]|nr:hypothetical protein BT69DRAFT_774060 [Atractiella rhizophila]